MNKKKNYAKNDNISNTAKFSVYMQANVLIQISYYIYVCKSV